jgi:putative transposase
MILFGERALQRALSEYVCHYHAERPHQGKGNVVLISVADHSPQRAGLLHCRERPGGLLKYYHRDAA